MPPFPKPRFDYAYELSHELAALRSYRRDKPGRQIPAKAKDKLLIGTWNVANLGVQDRLDGDDALIAEVMSWLDLVAVQEVNDDLRGIEAIHDHLPSRYDLLFSDSSATASGRRSSTTAGRSSGCGRSAALRSRRASCRRSRARARRRRLPASTAARTWRASRPGPSASRC